MKVLLPAALAVVSVASVVAGVALLSVPAAFVTGGLLGLGAAYVAAYFGRGDA